MPKPAVQRWSRLTTVVKTSDLKNAIHIGHLTGEGEVTRYVAGHGKGRVKAVLIGSIPPMLLKSDKNPDGLPMAVVDQFRDGTAYHRFAVLRIGGPVNEFYKKGCQEKKFCFDRNRGLFLEIQPTFHRLRCRGFGF
jgi:hypothetical protein